MATARALPADSSIYFDEVAGCERIVMPQPTGHGARIGVRSLLAVVVAAAGYFWLRALAALLRDGAGIDTVFDLSFVTLILATLLIFARSAFRRRVPESVIILGNALIHDSGADPFRRSRIEKGDGRREKEQFGRRRKRTYFAAAEAAKLARSDRPYPNRIYVETDRGRHDIGEALSPDERAWLFDHLEERLAARGGALGREATELIAQVRAEQSRKPIVEVGASYSRHRVDPLDFDDPLARQADWEPLGTAAASFRTHSLTWTGGVATFRATPVARGFALSFVMCGVLMAVIGAKDMLGQGGATAGGVMAVIFGLVFGLSSVFLIRSTFRPIVFDKVRGTYRYGWPPPATVPLSGITGIQLLGTVLDGAELSYTAYEMNLLMADGSREPVLGHGDADAIRAQADTLAQFIGTRVFDGIRNPAPTQRRVRQPVGDETLGSRLVAYGPITVITGVLLWVLAAPVEQPARAPAPPPTPAERRPERRATGEGPIAQPDAPESPGGASEAVATAAAPRTARTPGLRLVAPPGVAPFRDSADTEPGTGSGGTAPDPADARAAIEHIEVAGLRIDDVRAAGDRLRIDGRAESRRAVAAFMRSVGERVGKPRLAQLAAAGDGQPAGSLRFTIDVDPGG